MKLSRLSLGVFGAALLFSTGAFAQDSNNNGKLSLPEPVTVEGKQLPPGDYKVQWEGAGPNVEVKILKGKETVATAPARIVQEPNKIAVNSYGATRQQDGTRVLSTIYFAGKNFNLEILPAADTAAR